MKLGLFQLKNTLDIVPAIAQQYGKDLVARVPCASDGIDIDKINSCPLPLNVNVLWKGGKGRFTMPTDITPYKEDFDKGYYANLTHIPYLTSPQNETIPWGVNYTPEMELSMIKYHSKQVGSKLVSHSGTEMPVSAGIARYYLREIKDFGRLAQFDLFWKPSNGLWLADDAKVALAIEELKRLKRAEIPNFVYTIHINARRSNLALYPIIIEAIRHYIDYPIVVNEIGFNDTEAALVTDFTKMLKKQDIHTVIGFNDARTWAVRWTEEMIAAFLAFA
jgi:hypothetical protein